MNKFIKMIKVQRKMKSQRQERAYELTRERLRVLKEHYTVHLIELDRISLPDLPRKPKNERELRALCESIGRYGLLQPLTVRRISPDDSSLGGVFALVAGERRYQALKLLGVEKAPCVICDLRASAMLAAVVSARFSKLPPDAHEKAALLAALQAQTAMSAEQLCASCGISPKERAELALLADLEEDERALCRSSALPRYLTREIAAIPAGKERKRVLVECVHTLRSIFPAKCEGGQAGRRLLFSDIRPFYNSIEEMARRIRQGGIHADTCKGENPEYYEITLRIAKNSVHRVTCDSAQHPSVGSSHQESCNSTDGRQ